jgi:DNA-binding NarL/FixJ family response regulator
VPNLPTTPPDAVQSRVTVVLIDREPLYRWFVTESLNDLGIRVVGCGSMEEAALVLRQPRPLDLLMVDGSLIDGRECAGLRALRDRARSTPCVVLDADGAPWTLRLDPSVTAPKPVDSEAVAALVATHLQTRTPAA